MNLPTDTQYLAFLENVPIVEMRSAPTRDEFFKASETAATPRRTLRALAALLHRPMPHESLDSIAGCSNGPELVAELSRRGLEVPCERVSLIDRDGQKCYPGVCSLTTADRRKLHQWMSKRKQKGGRMTYLELDRTPPEERTEIERAYCRGYHQAAYCAARDADDGRDLKAWAKAGEKWRHAPRFGPQKMAHIGYASPAAWEVK